MLVKMAFTQVYASNLAIYLSTLSIISLSSLLFILRETSPY